MAIIAMQNSFPGQVSMSYSPESAYDAAVGRGNKLLEEINKPPQSTSPSKWKEYSDLEKNGWQKTFSQKRSVVSVMGAQDLADEYGNDTSAASNDKIEWTHFSLQQDFNERADGHYYQFFNVAGHTIYAVGLQNPLTEMGPEDAVPELKHWSDVTYLQWAELTSTPGDLKRVVQCKISNEESLCIIERVMAREAGKATKGLGFSERKIFREENGDPFKALLGTPNALGTAWMLAQHKGAEQLGWKLVESITLFSTAMQDLMIIEIGKHPKERKVAIGKNAA